MSARSAGARALAWWLPCLAVALAAGAETTGQRLREAAGADPERLAAAGRWLPFDGHVRLVRALGEGWAHGLESDAAYDALLGAAARRPRHPETLLAAGQAAAARGDSDLAGRLLAAAVRAAWYDAHVAIQAGRSRLDEAEATARRAALARGRAEAADRAGDRDGAAAAREEATRLLGLARRVLADVGRLRDLLAPDAHGRDSMEPVVASAEALLADLAGDR